MSIAAYSSVCVSSMVVVTGLLAQPSQAVWIMTPAQEKPAIRVVHSSSKIQMTPALLYHIPRHSSRHRKHPSRGYSTKCLILDFRCVSMAQKESIL